MGGSGPERNKTSLHEMNESMNTESSWCETANFPFPIGYCRPISSPKPSSVSLITNERLETRAKFFPQNHPQIPKPP